MLTSVLSDHCKLQGLWHAATPSCLSWWTREDWVQAKCHSSLGGHSVVFTVEATVDQCLAVGTTYTYQITQIQTWPVVVDSAAPISTHLDSTERSWLVMSTSLLQITRYLDSDSSDDKPTHTKKTCVSSVKMQSSIGWQIQNPTSWCKICLFLTPEWTF